jgi:hypothetical protein
MPLPLPHSTLVHVLAQNLSSRVTVEEIEGKEETLRVQTTQNLSGRGVGMLATDPVAASSSNNSDVLMDLIGGLESFTLRDYNSATEEAKAKSMGLDDRLGLDASDIKRNPGAKRSTEMCTEPATPPSGLDCFQTATQAVWQAEPVFKTMIEICE